MRGDFSAWNKDRSHNFRGTLHQQGRILLDRDWNAQTEITGEWQETAARDAFGADVAAVPAEEPLSFKVTNAAVVAGPPAHVDVTVKKGRLWADGLLVELPVDAVYTATYLGPPIQNPAGQVGQLPNNLRDAVILETWIEELSPFQDPDLLIEPALGGVDTTERLQTAFRLRLYRKAAGDTCDSLIPKLADDFPAKGKLTAELTPTVTIDGDCPVVQGGGYTGFEHRLYRIEIADTDKPSPEAYFKWSHFNGGLVGTGDFDATTRKVSIHGNRNAIVYSGSTNFYLEALDYVTTFSYWKVIYGAKVTLASDGTLSLPDPAASPGDIFKGAIPPVPTKGKRFFRLWNGIGRVADFTAKKDLPDNLGILIQFEPEGVGKYTPSDFWTFEVRAGGIGNPLVLIPNLPPQGIFYHRVPLAELHWTGNTVTGEDIEDCRRPFQPLTKLKTCCTYRVGDGIHSHGDFKKVQDAINALPKDGGEVCILPGTYNENIELKTPHHRKVILRGCGQRTVIKAPTDKPAIYVQYGRGITIESLAIKAHEEGIGILLEGEELTADGREKEKYLKDIILSQLFIRAARNNAIKGYSAQSLMLCESVVLIRDVRTPKPAVYLEGDDMLIERNEIRVLPDRFHSLNEALTNDPNLFIPARGATGGLQIGGGSERVRIVNNLIINGRGNGITLGRIDLMKDGKEIPSRDPFEPKGQRDDPCAPDPGHTKDGEENDDGYVGISGPPLYDILIKLNRIYNMGRNGIGIATFFSMGEGFDAKNLETVEKLPARGIISVSKLVIVLNRIERCVNINPPPIVEKMTTLMGYGGISLAHTENLVIRDNFITDNGPSFLEPICGIYVLIVEGVEISRNHILNNGIRTKEIPRSGTVNNGPRGGIWIARALSPTVEIGTLADTGEDVRKIPFASGIPAAKIHENIVTVPLGRSLTLFAQGPVSVVGNQFTSFSIQPVSFDELAKIFFAGQGLTAGAILQLLALLAGNVLIFDVATAAYLPAQQAGFKWVRTGEAARATAYEAAKNSSPSDTKDTNRVQAEEYAKKLRRIMANGTVLFANNQCHQNLLLPERSFAATSIFIASLDDVGFHNNQCDCDFEGDLIVVNVLAFGITVRLSDNRFREVFFNVFWSAATMGLMNITSDNESVHCLLIMGTLFLNKNNLVLLEMAGGVTGDITETKEHPCDRYSNLLANFGRAKEVLTVGVRSAGNDVMLGNIKIKG